MGKFYNITLGVLFAMALAALLLHFKKDKTNTTQIGGKTVKNTGSNNLPIAYFDVDSLSNNYAYSKLMQNELEKLTNDVETEVAKLQNTFDANNNEFQRKAQIGMSQQEQEAGMLALNKMRQDFGEKREAAIANLQKAKQKFEIELKKNIQDFITKYNTPQRFSFIIGDEPGFIYYRDTMLNITADIVKGLNEEYKKKN